jgi:hypothetical protein
VHVSFESIVDLSRFTVRVPEADAEKLPDILLAIPRQQREEMQRALGRLWQKWVQRAAHAAGGHCSRGFCSVPCQLCLRLVMPVLPPIAAGNFVNRSCRWTYTSYRPYATQFKEIQQQNAAQAGEEPPTLSLPARIPDLDPLHDDAFHTIMGWLHGRIPATR